MPQYWNQKKLAECLNASYLESTQNIPISKMAMKKGLFREQAVNAQAATILGEVLDIRPPGLRMLGFALVVLSLSLLVFLTLHDYQNKETVHGELVANPGIYEISPPITGTVTAIYVQEQDYVNKGDPLLAMTPEHLLVENKSVTEHSLLSLKQELTAVKEVYEISKRRFDLEIRQLLSGLKAEEKRLAQLELIIKDEMALQQIRDSEYQRARALYSKNYLSRTQIDQVKEAWLRQKAAVKKRVLEIDSVKQNSAEVNMALELKRYEKEKGLLEVRNKVLTLERQIKHQQADVVQIISAPISGKVDMLEVDASQLVQKGARILGLVPEQFKLNARLHVPSSAIGFLAPGQGVQIKYDTFPYQKFGVQNAFIETISSKAEVSTTPVAQLLSTANFYTVHAGLESQSIQVYDRNVPLKPGMQFTANILLEHRSLLEWFFEPLISLRGAL